MLGVQSTHADHTSTVNQFIAYVNFVILFFDVRWSYTTNSRAGLNTTV